MIKILIGGSPCTYWSISQKNGRETAAEGIGWELFKNYLIAKEKFNPDFFLYENNKSTAEPIKAQIRKELGVTEPSLFEKDNGVRFTLINSALVSAQNRQRFYITNWGDIEQPEDRGVLLKDILETGMPLIGERAYCLTASYSGAVAWDTIERSRKSMVAEPVCVAERGRQRDGKWEQQVEAREDNKTNKKVYEVKDGKITINGKQYAIKLPDGFYIIRKLTVTECCRLQTMPDFYMRAVSSTQGYKGLGNGWTAEVIIHLLQHAKIPLDEEIVVCSMYDGIGTGRYVLDKMGYKNVTYHAYEIDKYAMQVSMSNYPDIIQHGDAFAVRDDNWQLDVATK